MRIVKKTIFHGTFDFLELIVYDEEDIKQLYDFQHMTNVIVGLDMLRYLSFLPHVKK